MPNAGRQTMISARKVLAGGVLLLLGVAGGYVVGYFQGYGSGVGHPAIASAFGTMMTLKTLRDGKPDEAIRQLELTLDTQIVQSAVYDRSALHLTKVFEADDAKIKAAIAAYRGAHPSTFPDAEVRRLIQEGLEGK